MMVAAALALELGMNAPDWTKPCTEPVKTTKFASKSDPNYVWLSHIRRLPQETCEGGGITSFAERAEPLAFSPLPEAPDEPIAAAAEAETNRAPIVAEDELAPSAAAFNSGFIASFGGLAPGANFTPVVYVPAIPEAQTWLFLAAGLGALAFRRKA